MALLDRCIFTPASGGTADFVVSAAVTGYQTPAQANAVNATTYHYAAESSDKTQWEVGTGTYTTATATLARTTVIFSSNGGSKTNFTAAPTVMISALAEDFPNVTIASGKSLTVNNTLTLTATDGSTLAIGSGGTLASMAYQAASAVAITGGTIAGLTGLAIRDTSAAFDVTLAAVSSAALTAGRTLTLDMGNVAHTLALGTTAGTITFPNTAAMTVARIDAAQTFTGVQTFGAGSAAAPNLAVGNSTTGLYSVSTTGLGVSVNGSLVGDYGITTASLWTMVSNATSGTKFRFTSNGGNVNVVAFNNTTGSSANQFSMQASGTEKWSFGNDFNGNNGDTFYIYSANLTHPSLYVDNQVAKISLPSTYQFGWAATTSAENGPDAVLTRKGTANVQQGAADAAAPVAQTFSFQSVIAGTSNTAGTDATIIGSIGTGTGAGGKIILRTAPAGASGTSQNALATALTLTAPAVNMQPSVVVGNQALATTATDGFLYIPTCAGTPTGVPTTFTGRVAMVYDTTNHKFYIYDTAWKGGTNPGAFT